MAKSPLRTRAVDAFLSNADLTHGWTVLQFAFAARAELFPDALYPEQVIFEVARYMESQGHADYIKQEAERVRVQALKELKK